ncbi:MAG TPA: DNA internalization-related competence protein ComEC/Rec2 [Candidatus Acidoferrales bacterium]
MKLPAVWIFAAFASGVGIAMRWPASPKVWIAAAVLAIACGAVLLWRGHATPAWTCALLAWASLGGFAGHVERLAVPHNQITRVLSEKQVDLATPYRWRGRLRDDPMTLPWGQRFEIDLEQVEIAGETAPVHGGLRLNFYSGTRAAEPPTGLRAGDRVEALAKAKPPRNFLDPGAIDLRGILARQHVDLIGSLRSGELLQLIDRPPPTVSQRLARARGILLARLDALFVEQPERGAILRAMLLGDRSFVDSDVVQAFQKTASYHVLVIAGLHVGALVVFFLWIGKRVRLPPMASGLLICLALAGYVGIVQDRPPILRAALMAALFLLARPLFRRVDLLNTIAIAGLIFLMLRPSILLDSSFQLSFLAAAVIAAVAIPWMERSSVPYRRGLNHLGDVTRDAGHPPKIAQFRIELRAAAQWMGKRLSHSLAGRMNRVLSLPIRAGPRLWEIILLSTVIQVGMLPLLARDFHRVSLAGPVSNLFAVILTGIIVPLGFLALAFTFVWMRAAVILAKSLSFCVGLLLTTIQWFAHWPRLTYRIPGSPLGLVVLFFIVFAALAAVARAVALRRSAHSTQRRLLEPIRLAEWAAGLAVTALAIVIAVFPFAPQLNHGKFEVDVLDVGQGDSIFAVSPMGRTMLIDGGGQAGAEAISGARSGPDIGEDVVSPYLWSRGIKKLDVVALTHAHHDHLDGLHAVLANFRVSELWIGRDEETPAFLQLLAEARARGTKIVQRVQNDRFDWDGVQGRVLWPADISAVTKPSNDDSLVMTLDDGVINFLLPGDIEKKVENELVAEDAPLKADFLKVPHHGSKTSSTDAFVAAVAPKIAVVSVGEGNQFGHPVESVVERYAATGVRFLRTDRDGEVTALSDGKDLSVRTFAEAPQQ